MNCPDSNIQGWFDYQHVYKRFADEVPPNGIIVELGVWKGASLSWLAHRLIELNKPHVKLYGVDKFTHTEWDGYATIQRLDRERGEHRTILEQASAILPPNAELIIEDTIKAADRFADRTVNFVFVDDQHESPHVARELAAWLPKLKRPTWIAGHDYPGNIKEAVDAAFPHVVNDHGCWLADVL